MKRTTDEPVRKWPAPIMGHVIYGVVTALAFEALEALGERSGERVQPGREGSRDGLAQSSYPTLETPTVPSAS